MRFNGSAWAALGAAGLTNGTVQYTSLAFAPDGTPHLAFNMQRAQCLRFVGGAWAAAGPASFSTGAASYVSLAVSAAGLPFVAFSDAGLSGKATVVALAADRSAWQPLGGAGSTPARADYTSLVRAAGVAWGWRRLLWWGGGRCALPAGELGTMPTTSHCLCPLHRTACTRPWTRQARPCWLSPTPASAALPA